MPRYDTRIALGRRLLLLERLEDRAVPAVIASFDAATKTLTVTADNLDNAVGVFRDAGGVIRVSNNGVGVAITGGAPAAANTTLIRVLAQGGNDVVTLNEVNGALPKANLFGGTGDDTLTGGSGTDQLFGNAGEDVLFGKGGADSLLGGSEEDTLTGGTGNDTASGEDGNDDIIWNPGDDTDVNEGGAGVDTVEVNSGNGDEQFTVTANGTRVRFDRVNPAPFSLDIGTSENLVVNMNGGNDSFSATGNLAALLLITADGGAGNDTILGGNGLDNLFGSDGDDFIDGGQGNDIALMGAGNDVFQWDPGDGSDVVEGGAGTDTMLFNGSALNEIFDASAVSGRVKFTRNIGNITMTLDGVERINLNALGGADTTTVNDLTGTDLAEFTVNLGNFDGAADTVIVNATAGDDLVAVTGNAAAAFVNGLRARVGITGTEPDNDRLVVNGLRGNDVVSATGLSAAALGYSADGGADDDILIGGGGVDTLDGNAGTDTLIGGPGTDTLSNGETVVQ